MAFTEDMVSKLITDPVIFARGKAYYSAGRVKELSVTTKGSTSKLSSTIRGAQEYQVECSVNRSGTYLYGVHCNCPDFQAKQSCLHVAATLLAFTTYDPTVKAQTTSAAGERLLTAFRPVVQPQVSHPGEIRLVPTLILAADHLSIELSIGDRQLHPVPSISNLCQQVRQGETVSYGKKLTFRHTLSAFDHRSQALLELLQGIVQLRSFLVKQEFLSVSDSNGDQQLALPPEALDRFFELYCGGSLKSSKGPLQTVVLSTKPPQLSFLLLPTADGISMTAPGIQLFPGSKWQYLYENSTLYRLEQPLADHLKVLQEQTGDLFFQTSDIPAFCNFILPVLSQCGKVKDPENALAAYTPETPEIKIMLDTPEQDCLTATMSYVYETLETDPFDKSDPQPFRNLRQETMAVNLVETWMPEVDAAQRNWTLRGTDEQIYSFLTTGLSQLADVGTLLCTDRFEGIHRTRPRMSVGVTLASGLLELQVQSSDFPIEELEAILTSCRLRRRFHRLKNGVFLELDDDALRGLRELDETIGLSPSDIQNGTIRLPGYRALEVDQAFSEDRSASFLRDSSFREMLRDFRSAEQNEFPLPQEMEGVLRFYQRSGFRWLKTLEQYGFGGILADDMGLGKTIQMITFLLSAKENGMEHPALIVCPASLVLNWLDEFSRFAPNLNVMAVSGTSIYRRFQLNGADNYDVLITSYDTLKRDVDQYELMTFSYCILDEAQYIKNHNTKSCQAARRVHAACRFALTGTPVENRLSELWSIFDFLMPGYLSNYARFRDRFELPIVKNQDTAAQERLGRIIEPFVLRRLKKDVLTELPSKTETVQYAILSGEQQKLYEANVYQARQELEGATDRDRIQILAALTRLRQICCDPRLCVEDFAGESAKLELCMQLVGDAVASGHQILLFSQFTSMLSLIAQELKAQEISYFTLEGSTSTPKRAELVKRFNAGEASVFLISLKAGGTGLNLTAADIVIHYDPWWNLAAQNQATDRAHRIGQQNPVQVYQLIIKDSIEERILNLQKEKGALAESIIAFGTGSITTMSKDDLLSLLADT